MHYYTFNISDFALSTRHLTLEEEAVYRRLLDHYYDTEQPIPEKTDRVIRRLGLGSYVDILDFVLNEFFVLEDDGWHNLRADIVINEYKKKADTARSNGKKGGRPPKDQGLKTQSVNSANQEKSESKTNHKPITNNHKPITNNHKPITIIDYSAFGLGQNYIDEIIRIRKKNAKTKKQGDITQRVANALAEEFNKSYAHGLTIDKILNEWELRGWMTYKHEWVVKNESNREFNQKPRKQTPSERAAEQGRIAIQMAERAECQSHQANDSILE